MSACRRKKVRKLRLRRCRVCGGYMEPGKWVTQPMDKSHLSSMRKGLEEELKKKKIRWTDYLNWYKLADKLANKNVIDESTMLGIIGDYNSSDENRKKNAIDRMSDELVI